MRKTHLRRQRYAWVLFVVVAAMACATTPQTGVIAAHWTPPGKSSEPIVLGWESESKNTGRIFCTLGRGGQRFTGHYIRIVAGTKVETVAPVLDTWGPIWSGYDWGGANDSWWWGPAGEPMGEYMASSYYPIFVQEYTGKAVASLIGDKGDTMRCRFTLRRPQEGLMGGGTGECQTSNGSRISADF